MNDCPPVQYVRTPDGASIAYWTLGSGPKTLAIHPLSFSHLTREQGHPRLRELYDLLASDLELLRYDPRAAGLSGPAQDFSAEAFLCDIESVLARTGGGPVALLAFVGAAPLAARFAAAHPADVSSLVLLCPEIDEQRRRVIMRALRSGTPEHAMQRFNRLLNPDGTGTLGELIGGIRRANERNWERLVGKDGATQMMSCPEELLSKVSCPTLVVHYPEHAFSDGPNIAGRMANARLLVRDGANAPLWDPDFPGLMSAVRAFIHDHVETPVDPATDACPPPTCLSPREREVVCLVSAGLPNPEIAQRLCISRSTVARHVSSALGKTGLINRTELAVYASRHRLA
ncbi:MAG: DNA-binding response regulator, NarL/FixJ family [Chloroflexi bacterium]|nr:MAG: DNA-binding response regulator, NarL/FixJ family [Chloroflexota bacterium]